MSGLRDVKQILHEVGISDVLLWGENAMYLHGIPAVSVRDDLILKEEDMDRAVAALVAKGWRELSLNVPPQPAGFWVSGWQEFMGSGRRLLYPESYKKSDAYPLLLLPRTGERRIHIRKVVRSLCDADDIVGYYKVFNEEELNCLARGNPEFWKPLLALE
ncbi:hypothetical protein H0H92_014859 [Tricholoma furcatifolium]|nr:hypothetical protein H0H92_014859 [Tricholoma furcatifolium]